MEQYFYLKEHFVMDFMVHHPGLQPPAPPGSYASGPDLYILNHSSKIIMIMDDSCYQNLILHVCQVELSYFQPILMGNTSKYMSINKLGCYL